jgi:hypothetical protein
MATGDSIQFSLNRLAGRTGMDAQGAANVIASTVGMDLVGALNVKAGTWGLELNGVCRRLATLYGGNPELDAQGALASISAFSQGDGPMLVSGYYASLGGTVAAKALATTNLMFATPFPIERSATADRIGVHVTANVASSTVRLGIFGDTGGNPGSLILDAGTVDSSTTGFKEITISQALTPIRVWLVAVQQGGATNVSVHGIQDTGVAVGLPTSGWVPFNSSGLETSGAVAGALPGSFPTIGNVAAVTPRIVLRIA